MYSVQCPLNTVHCTLYSIQYTVYSVQCIVYIIHYTVYSIHCSTRYTKVFLTWNHFCLCVLCPPTSTKRKGTRSISIRNSMTPFVVFRQNRMSWNNCFMINGLRSYNYFLYMDVDYYRDVDY